MSIRGLSWELQKIAIEELNEEPERTEETLNSLREWIQKQPHLTANLSDQNLINFVRGSKWSIQRTKEKIDRFYTTRTMHSEFFSNRDPFSPEIQNVLKAGILNPLPRKNHVGPTIIYIRYCRIGNNKTPVLDFCKVLFMFLDILINEDDNLIISGIKLIADNKHSPLEYYPQVTPTVVTSCTYCLEDAYPIRFKCYAAINMPEFAEKIFRGIVRAFINEKHKKKILVYSHSSLKDIKELIDEEFLPEELGGTNGSLTTIAAEWKAKVESYKDWFLDDAKYGSNEKLRPNDSKFAQDLFGLEGTFRKLGID